jgi:PBP1b-binding outer membrane lipoprotein LpoB
MKQKMKQSVLIAALLALGLAGCQKKEEAPAPEVMEPIAPAPQAPIEPMPEAPPPGAESMPPAYAPGDMTTPPPEEPMPGDMPSTTPSQ